MINETDIEAMRPRDIGHIVVVDTEEQEGVVMRYIIECKDSSDIILGMKGIQALADLGTDYLIISFEESDLWYVRKTKTGYSARKSR